MSTAIQNRSRGVSVKRPSRSSAAAKATEWTSTSSPPPNASVVSAKTRSRSSSERTSHAVTSFVSTVAARSRTFFSMRSPWYVNASCAPSDASRSAIAQAIDRLLATPSTSACLPSNRPGIAAILTPTGLPSRQMRVFSHDLHTYPLPDGHRFPLDKYRLVRESAEHLEGVQLTAAEAASWEQLRRTHTGDWLARVREGRIERREQLALGLPWSPELVERSRRSTGATVMAARAALEEGVAANLGGGTHHAFAHAGRGFCVFNDVVTAIRALRVAGRMRRVLVVDLPQALRRARPELCFVLAGADPYEGDRLGRLALTKHGLRERDVLVRDALALAGVPICLTLAGGYAEDIRDTVEINVNTLRVFA